MIERRGVAMGVLAALIFGALAVSSWLPTDVVIRWSARHPVLDRLLFAPILFCGLAFFTPLSLWVSLGIAALGTAVLFGVARLRQAWSRRQEPEISPGRPSGR